MGTPRPVPAKQGPFAWKRGSQDLTLGLSAPASGCSQGSAGRNLMSGGEVPPSPGLSARALQPSISRRHIPGLPAALGREDSPEGAG